MTVIIIWVYFIIALGFWIEETRDNKSTRENIIDFVYIIFLWPAVIGATLAAASKKDDHR